MKKKRNWLVAAGVVVLAALGVAFLEPMRSKVEEPKYRVVEHQGDIEIRDYAPVIVAEADISGEQYKALGEGFRLIADYIFGNNSSTQKVAMTAPVTQQSRQKIAMTAPVTQQGEGRAWQVAFVMPSSFTMETLPQPNNPAVKLKEIAGKRFAVIRFSGLAAQEDLERRTAELNEFVSARNLKTLSAPTYAFYNPPWTLPFLRRNEVMVEIAG